MPDANLKYLLHKNYMYIIRAAVGTHMFRHTYVLNKTTGKVIDTAEGGGNACAYVASSIMTLVGLIDHPHSTVITTLEKMKEAGWYEIKEPKPGAVVHWPVQDGHAHLGFYLGNNKYMSNYSEKFMPATHGPARPARSSRRMPDAFYWHPRLDED